MAIFIPEFRRETDVSSPLESIISGLTQGAEKGLAYRRQQALDKEESEMNQLRKALLKAQAEKARRPASPTLNAYEKALQGKERIRQQYGENSQEFKEADEYAKRVSQGTPGLEASFDPKTGAFTMSQGKRGTGTTGQMVDGKYRTAQTTGAATKSQTATISNKVREDLADEFKQPYMGLTASVDLGKDYLAYLLGSKEAGERLVQAAVASKLAPEYATLQLAAQQVPATVESTKNQLHAIQQGWPSTLDTVTQNLPPELQKKAKEDHDRLLKKLSKARETFIAQGMPLELPTQEEEVKETISEKVLIEAPNGKRYQVPIEKVEEVIKRGGRRV